MKKANRTAKKNSETAKNAYGICDRAVDYFQAAVAALPKDIKPQADECALAIFAQSSAELERLNIEIQEEGLMTQGLNGFGINPKASARQMVIKTLLASSAQLGLTPASRMKIKATVEGKVGRKKSKEEEYLGSDE